jgi:hypothetical protein
VITVLFFLIFSGYLVFINSNKLKEESYEKLTSYTESIKQQYQLQLASYDQAVTNLLSDKEFLLDLRTLSYLDTKEENVLALERSYLRITEKISNYSNLADFYRVNVITSKNDFLTNDIKLSSQRETAIEKVEALLQTADYNNGVFLVPNFQDVWGNAGGDSTFVGDFAKWANTYTFYYSQEDQIQSTLTISANGGVTQNNYDGTQYFGKAVITSADGEYLSYETNELYPGEMPATKMIEPNVTITIDWDNGGGSQVYYGYLSYSSRLALTDGREKGAGVNEVWISY